MEPFSSDALRCRCRYIKKINHFSCFVLNQFIPSICHGWHTLGNTAHHCWPKDASANNDQHVDCLGKLKLHDFEVGLLMRFNYPKRSSSPLSNVLSGLLNGAY